MMRFDNLHTQELDPEVIRSLNKSSLREKILLFLNDVEPKYAYLSEIARSVRSDPSNVSGCLEGMKKRYSERLSLVEMGLVEVIEKDRHSYYGITEKGQKAAEYIKEKYRKSY
ncbi:MAG: Transcriptional regulator containing HTH domain [Candidatus Methanohalarchaeum thermophilum]|uniref:Transcriptional regulator containing HTH domain n=1 Tax=Methanohalarchaeum thermophilum TaxID=1903181 RepID=A0A1Q6DXH5_METT1|nr:MAG: Transcriptional regulator containing HTH domain [Candidatus Methanohalarchaeum thermophilum]